MRVGDQDRERVTHLLKQRAAEGYLSLDTLTHRVERTLGAHTIEELRRVVADVPASRRRPLALLLALVQGARAAILPARYADEVTLSLGGLPARSGTVTIGRGPDAEVVLEPTTVSRHHAQLAVTSAGYVLRDLGSKNGTYVNGEPIDTCVLRRDDVVALADVGIVFEP